MCFGQIWECLGKPDHVHPKRASHFFFFDAFFRQTCLNQHDPSVISGYIGDKRIL